MFNAFRTMFITFFAAITSLFTAAHNGSKSLEAISEWGLQEAELVRDKGKIANAKVLQEVAEQLKSL